MHLKNGKARCVNRVVNEMVTSRGVAAAEGIWKVCKQYVKVVTCLMTG